MIFVCQIAFFQRLLVRLLKQLRSLDRIITRNGSLRRVQRGIVFGIYSVKIAQRLLSLFGIPIEGTAVRIVNITAADQSKTFRKTRKLVIDKIRLVKAHRKSLTERL